MPLKGREPRLVDLLVDADDRRERASTVKMPSSVSRSPLRLAVDGQRPQRGQVRQAQPLGDHRRNGTTPPSVAWLPAMTSLDTSTVPSARARV